MLFLEEWEEVKSLENEKSDTEIAQIIKRGAQTVKLYRSMSESDILEKLKNRLYSKTTPKRIKKSPSLPGLWITEKGEFVYQEKFKKYWYKRNTVLITSSRGKIDQVSFFWKGTYYRAHKIIAEALFPDYSKFKFVLFKDGNSLNINPSNLLLSNSRTVHRCKQCGKPIRKNELCINCKNKTETSNRQREKRESEANQIEEGLQVLNIRLQPHQRKILNYYKNGYSLTEIAKIENVSRQAVHSALQRIKARAKIYS